MILHTAARRGYLGIYWLHRVSD